MNSSAESHPWSARKLFLATVIAFVAQIALIYWFSSRAPVFSRPAEERPAVQFAAGVQSELLALNDPTIFSRAHPRGYSGPAWLATGPSDYQPAEKIRDEPASLDLAPETLGATFRAFMLTNDSGKWSPQYLVTPPPTRPTSGLVLNTTSASRLQVRGPLEKYPILNTPPLPVWTNADILAPSEVLLLVDAHGNPISATLVLPRSGYKPGEHDRSAVELATKVIFDIKPSPSLTAPDVADADLHSGRLIFYWHTVAPGTNDAVNPR